MDVAPDRLGFTLGINVPDSVASRGRFRRRTSCACFALSIGLRLGLMNQMNVVVIDLHL